MIPGVSRSGAVMTAGLILNIKRNVLVEFTFLLAVPTMFAATLYSLYKSRDILSAEYLQTLGIGFIVSFIVAFIVVKAFLDYVRKFDFIPFGIYRIIFGLFILITLFS
jgi:undecaprenyl-diphosphatase